jgi:tripartite-type tricarboxylate transporter receptor subunit TctC
VIGMQAAAASRPDGYTLTTGGLGHNVLPPATLRGLPLDIPTALLPIAQVAEFVNALVVRTDHPANSVPELVEYLRASKRKPLYGSNGVGSSSQMTAELFAMRTGLKFDHVPYKGAADALVGTANGDLDICFMNLPPTLAMVEGKRLKALAVTSSKRSALLPDIPTLAEVGVPGIEGSAWIGFVISSKVPADIQKKLSDALIQAIRDPEVTKRLQAQFMDPAGTTPAEFRAYMDDELKRWEPLIKKLGIKGQ